MTYLITKYGKSEDHPLYPKDPYIRARIDQRLYFECGMLFSSLIQLLRPTIYGGELEISDKQWLNVQLALEALETFLVVDPYLVGDQLTVADLSVITTLTQLEGQMDFDSDKFPNIIAYIKRMEKLPYFNELNTKNLATFAPLMEKIRSLNKAAAEAAQNLSEPHKE